MATWLITGISRGLGLELAKAVLAAGDTVIGTVRGAPPAIPETEGSAAAGRLHVLKADLANEGAAAEVVHRAFALAGRIDVIVNNAGYGLLGAVETSTDDQLRRLFDVDVFAPIRIVRTALPYLRTQGGGHIVTITSIAGRAPSVGSALYAAAKYALEGFSAALALEVAPLGIKMTAVAPGAFRTDFLSDHSVQWSGDADAAYADTIGHSNAVFAGNHGRQAGDPVRAAQVMLAAVRAESPPRQLLLGSDALRRAREKLSATIAEMDVWAAQTRNTDFPGS
ncbi:SDR family NAD(P)-dependent oxidoreductase [Oleisolibacter albus]|uniref:SDR family NAD(P)-dependent oxidoreductase n=1 Tax=Oleisolibacter albus TaxID=2171757 RepID=UPI000DF18F00|nr:SDR family NAD(P)-dependent oxidoreductase [Oleisolibacter albus]